MVLLYVRMKYAIICYKSDQKTEFVAFQNTAKTILKYIQYKHCINSPYM